MRRGIRHTAVLALGFGLVALALADCGGTPESTPAPAPLAVSTPAPTPDIDATMAKAMVEATAQAAPTATPIPPSPTATPVPPTPTPTHTPTPTATAISVPANDRLKALEYEAKIAADTATELEKAAFLELTNLPLIGVMNPRDQYEIVMRQSMGSLANHPTVIRVIDSNYGSVLGRYVLENLMEIDITDTTTPREYFHQFVARELEEKPAEFFGRGKMDTNWARLVEYSKDLSDPDPEGDEEIVGRVIAMSDVWQIAAAKAKAGITGRDTYGRLAERAFDVYVERYEGERAVGKRQDIDL